MSEVNATVRPLVLLTRPMAHRAGLAVLAQHVDVLELREGEIPELHERIGDCEAILATTPTFIGADLMDRAPRLKLISATGVGVEHIDVDAASERGVLVANMAGVGARAIAEHSLMLMLALAKKLVWTDRMTKAGNFDARWNDDFHEITGRTLALIGYGAIAKDLAAICRNAFDMRILAFGRRAEDDHFATAVTLEQACTEADIVSVHLPFSRETSRMIGAAQFALMKPSAWLINTGRGGVIDESALIAALRSGGIAGAALDVFDPEPAQPDNPLLNMDNVIVTPHNAGMTEESLERLSIAAADTVVAVLAGRVPNNLVNPSVWPHRRAGS